MKTSHETLQPLKAFYWIFLSSLCFSIMGITVKFLSTHFSPNSLVFYRSSLNLILFLPLFLNPHFRLIQKGSRVLLIRGFFGFCGVSLHFYALKNLPMGVAYLASYMAPLFVILFSFIFLKERLSKTALLFMGVVVIGFYFLSAPTWVTSTASPKNELYPILPLLGAVLGSICAAAALTAVRAAGKNFKPELIVFYLSLVSVFLSFPGFFINFEPLQSSDDLFLILVMGGTATIAQVCLTKGYQFAKAGPVSVMSGMSSVFSLGWGYILFQEVLQTNQLFGAVLILIGVSGLSLRQS